MLQERAFERLGGNETLHIEARLVALTNIDLQAAVAEGRFREDLFFRLNVLTISVPALRERRADILPLADHLLGTLRGVHGRANVQLSDASRSMLAAYDWPGNVRELRNALERAVVFSRGETLNPEDFPGTVRAAAPGGPEPPLACAPCRKSKRTSSPPHWKPPGTRSENPPKSWASAARPYSTNANATTSSNQPETRQPVCAGSATPSQCEQR